MGSIRNTQEYADLKKDQFRATMIAEGVEDATDDELRAAWQVLHDTGAAYRLQGWFGRTAMHMLDENIIED